MSLHRWHSGVSRRCWMVRLSALCAGAFGVLAPPVWGATARQDAALALRAALNEGAAAAVGRLGRFDGFWAHPQLRIELPGALKEAEPLLRAFGQGERLDALRQAMNRGAEQAVSKARPMLEKAVQELTIRDAQAILQGGETSVTQFFQEKTRAKLTAVFLPEVGRATAALGVARQYNELAAKVAEAGLMAKDDSSIERYVTQRALDGLYFLIGEEERKIRRDPMAYANAVLTRVFGALR